MWRVTVSGAAISAPEQLFTVSPTLLNVSPEITKAAIEAVLTGDITSHSHKQYITAITKAMVEAVLTGNISSHTHTQYLTAVTKAAVEAVLTGNITSHTHSQYLTSHQDISGKLDKTGGTMTGALTAQNNTNYTTKQVRNIFIVAEGSSLPSGSNGDICLVYAP
jgi:diphthamide synthase (EF-2-diphthine--ammonia ligase)